MHYKHFVFPDLTNQQPGGDLEVAEGDGGEADDGD
jgi:hypothetical protein